MPKMKINEKEKKNTKSYNLNLQKANPEFKSVLSGAANGLSPPV